MKKWEVRFTTSSSKFTLTETVEAEFYQYAMEKWNQAIMSETSKPLFGKYNQIVILFLSIHIKCER